MALQRRIYPPEALRAPDPAPPPQHRCALCNGFFRGAAGLTASVLVSTVLAFIAKSRWTSASRSSFFLLIATTERDSIEYRCGAPNAMAAAAGFRLGTDEEKRLPRPHEAFNL